MTRSNTSGGNAWEFSAQRKETPDDCLAIVQKIRSKVGFHIPEDSLGSAHRTGQAIGENPAVSIVKLKNFSDGSAFDKRWREISELLKYSVHLDLTKERLYVLKDSRSFLAAVSSSPENLYLQRLRISLQRKYLVDGTRYLTLMTLKVLSPLPRFKCNCLLECFDFVRNFVECFIVVRCFGFLFAAWNCITCLLLGIVSCFP